MVAPASPGLALVPVLPVLPGVVWVECADDPPEAWDVLDDADRARALTFCPSRRDEFVTARLCARRALQALGAPTVPLGRGRAGQPLWPAGVVGSLTHCRLLRAAAAGCEDIWAGVGIDVEPDAPLPHGVAAFVLSSTEQRRIAVNPVAEAATDRLAFCVKEAVYKACWALGGQRLGFADAEVLLRGDGSLTVELQPRPAGRAPLVSGRPVRIVRGRWTRSAGILRVAVGVPAAR